MSEYHILIAWNKANITNESIKDCFNDSLILKGCVMYQWDENYAINNYSAFYGENLNDIQYKVDHCGTGLFRVFLVEDKLPCYENRITSHGECKVNINMFDLKAKLRALTGGGHLIHASDSQIEANLNSVSLFGLRIEEAAETLFLKNDVDISTVINRNITGALGWNNWNEMLEALKKTTDFVVLRNIETILDNEHSAHGDTDILVKDLTVALTICVAVKEAPGKNRVLYSTVINNKRELLDFRYLGDGYYDLKWEQEMLSDCRRRENSSIYVMDDVNQAYSMLYHALVHKPNISKDYLEKINNYFETKDRNVLNGVLKQFMDEKEYSYSKPNDSSVFIHPDYFEIINIGRFYKVYNTLKVYKNQNGENNRKDKCIQTIYKILSKEYYLAINIARKIKQTIRSASHK